LASWAVDVHLDLAIRILLRQIQQLGNDQIGDDVVDRRAHEYDPILEQQRKDVIAAFAAARLFDDHWDGIGDGLHQHLSAPLMPSSEGWHQEDKGDPTKQDQDYQYGHYRASVPGVSRLGRLGA